MIPKEERLAQAAVASSVFALKGDITGLTYAQQKVATGWTYVGFDMVGADYRVCVKSPNGTITREFKPDGSFVEKRPGRKKKHAQDN